MAIDKFDIDTIPTLVKTLDTDETVVTVTVYDRVARSAVALDADTASQYPAGSGSWYWDVAFTTRPASGVNQYEAYMIGTTYGQRRRILFDWVENITLFKGVVYIDPILGTAGQGRYVGTDFRPSNNLADALAIAVRIKTKTLYLTGALTLDRSIAGYIVKGVASNFGSSIALAGFSIAGCSFESLTLSGAWNGSAYCNGCQLYACTNVEANVTTSVIIDSISIKDGGIVQANDTAFLSYAGTCLVDMQNSAMNICACGGGNGVIKLVNLAGGIFSVNGTFIVQVDSSVVAGQYFVNGIGNTDGVPGVPLTWIGEYTKAYFNPGLVLLWVDMFVPGSVQNTLLSEHLDAGTTGKALSDIDTDVGNIYTYSQSLSGIAGLIKAQTDQMNFTGTDIKATLDSEKVTVTSNEDKTGYALTSAYDPAKTASSQSSITTLQSTANSIENYSISISGVVGSIHLDTDTVETKLTTIEGKVDVVDTVVDSIKLDTKSSGEIRGADNDDLKDLSDQLDTVASNTKKPVAGFDS